MLRPLPRFALLVIAISLHLSSILALAFLSGPSCGSKELPDYPFDWPLDILTVVADGQTTNYSYCGVDTLEDFASGRVTITVRFQEDPALCGSLDVGNVANFVFAINTRTAGLVVPMCAKDTDLNCWAFTSFSTATMSIAGESDSRTFAASDLRSSQFYTLATSINPPLRLSVGMNVEFKDGVRVHGRFRMLEPSATPVRAEDVEPSSDATASPVDTSADSAAISP